MSVLSKYFFLPFSQFTYIVNNKPKYNVNDIVYEKLDIPDNALGSKQPTNSFILGDCRFSHVSTRISEIVVFRDKSCYR